MKLKFNKTKIQKNDYSPGTLFFKQHFKEFPHSTIEPLEECDDKWRELECIRQKISQYGFLESAAEEAS